MHQTDKKVSQIRPITSYLLLFVFICLTLFVTFLLYRNVQSFFQESLQRRLLSIANTASAQFTRSELDVITGPESVGTFEYEKVVNELNLIREKNEHLKYIYVLRRTEDPNVFSFVADADSMDPTAVVDLNNDGVIDESDELNTPGDPYDVSEFPELRNEAFTNPTVDQELTIDQWGTFLSASAPVTDSNNEADEFIGIDVEVSDFNTLMNQAFVPFVLFLLFLLLILTTQTVFLVQMWGSRINFFLELDRQKDELLGLVSHQLATPVSSIKWYVEMLIDGDLGELKKEQKEHIQAMYGIGQNMSDLVGMILDVSRIQLGRIKIEKQELDLNAFFKDIMTIIQPKAEEKKVEFITNVPANLPVAQLDRKYTNMTIENLLTNAVKYTPAGGKVMFDVVLKDGNVCVTVKDTGMGIPKADQAKIFGKMFRASNARNSIDGNGFGLFVAKGAVEAQGGKIWFESTEGKGTTFYVVLPLKD